MAYNKVEVPWHGLGFPVEGDLTPAQMMKAAKVNWSVEKVPVYCTVNKKRIYVGHEALVRTSDHKVLDVVTDDWNPVQNAEAFEFFNDFVAAGDMNMETAGALRGGSIVFALARINESFELFGGRDKIKGYMLFTNPHRYGWSTSVSFTPIRVVCMNTLNLSLGGHKKGSDKIVRVNHRKEFDADEVKTVLGISKDKLAKYKEMATFLGSVKAKNEDVVDYFKRIFPVITTKEDSKKELSKPAKLCVECLDTQPGAELGQGTWWAAYNSVTYYTDHVAGRGVDSRLTTAWYGPTRAKKIKALETAVEMAEASR